MTSLFCFLKHSNEKFDYCKFERLGIILPDIFKSFCNNFELGTEYDSYYKYLSKDNQLENLGNFYIKHNDSYYQWDGFIALEELYRQYLTMLELNGRIVYHQEEYFDGKLFYIGMLSSTLYLYIGTTGEAVDKMYIYNDDGLFLIAENIFDLCHKFEYKYLILNLLIPQNFTKTGAKIFGG